MNLSKEILPEKTLLNQPVLTLMIMENFYTGLINHAEM